MAKKVRGSVAPEKSVVPAKDLGSYPPVYRARQLAEGGPDPFQDADLPESDPVRSASGAGRERLDVIGEVHEMLHEKRVEERAKRGEHAPITERRSGEE